VDSLAASIAAKGLLQPLLVRPMGDKFEVVSAAAARWP
jgi:ParB-like chromosome segregation protein Spo0J